MVVFGGFPTRIAQSAQGSIWQMAGIQHLLDFPAPSPPKTFAEPAISAVPAALSPSSPARQPAPATPLPSPKPHKQKATHSHQEPEFPPPWDACWQKVYRDQRPALSIVWTYFQLGHDLLHAPDPSRRRVLGQLIGSMPWEKGTVRFWPVAVPHDNRLVVNVGLFWRGLRALGAKTVCCFGGECRSLFAKELAVPILPDQSFLPYRSGAFLFLPDLGAMSKDEAMFAAARSILLEHVSS